MLICQSAHLFLRFSLKAIPWLQLLLPFPTPLLLPPPPRLPPPLPPPNQMGNLVPDWPRIWYAPTCQWSSLFNVPIVVLLGRLKTHF